MGITIHAQLATHNSQLATRGLLPFGNDGALDDERVAVVVGLQCDSLAAKPGDSAFQPLAAFQHEGDVFGAPLPVGDEAGRALAEGVGPPDQFRRSTF